MSLAMPTQTAGAIRLKARTPSSSQPMKGAFAFELIQADEARDWAARGVGKAVWTKLYEDCPWSTAFLSPGYFDVWCRHYSKVWSPLLIVARRVDGTVAGIMPLAMRRGLITGAGAHQAEYHGWVSSAQDAEAFLSGALATIAEALPGHALRLRYLPPALPSDILIRLEQTNPRIELFRHVSHEFAIDRRKIAETRKKKGNKSKLNRLTRLGELSFRRLDAQALASQMDRVAAMYDFRQGARNGVCPFLDDPQKRAFHLDWIKALPEQMHATGMFLNDRMISALLLVTSGNDTHLAISAHAPELAEHSPNKLHIYEAALALADEGRSVLDLTPGDDAWKERFSTSRRVIFELVMHASLQRAGVARTRRAAKELARRALARVGLSKQLVASRVRALAAAAGRAVNVVARVPPREEVYHLDLARVDVVKPDAGVSRDDLDALMRWGPALTGQRRQPFLHQALHRIESGDRCYTMRTPAGLAGLGWLSARAPTHTAADAPPNGHRATLHDFALANGADRPANLRALIVGMLHDLMANGARHEIFATVSPRDASARATLAQLGFHALTRAQA